MGISISDQAAAFVLSGILGAFLAVCYDGLRLVRRAARKRWVTPVLDAVFGLVFFFFMFCFAMRCTESRVRGYMFLGSALGAALYFLVLSTLVQKLLRLAAAAAVGVLGFVTAPLCLWITFLKKISKNAKYLFKFFSKWYTIKGTFIRPPKGR